MGTELSMASSFSEYTPTEINSYTQFKHNGETLTYMNMQNLTLAIRRKFANHFVWVSTWVHCTFWVVMFSRTILSSC